MAKRLFYGAAAGVLVAGVAAMLLIPNHYLGPCDVRHEFACGTDHRVKLRILVGVIALFGSLILWAIGSLGGDR